MSWMIGKVTMSRTICPIPSDASDCWQKQSDVQINASRYLAKWRHTMNSLSEEPGRLRTTALTSQWWLQQTARSFRSQTRFYSQETLTSFALTQSWRLRKPCNDTLNTLQQLLN